MTTDISIQREYNNLTKLMTHISTPNPIFQCNYSLRSKLLVILIFLIPYTMYVHNKNYTPAKKIMINRPTI